MKLLHTIPVQNELGEGVIWDQERQRVWWTDIVKSKLYRLNPESLELESWDTPERLCCFAPVAGQDYLVAAFASGFAFYHPEQNKLEWISKIEADNPGTRLNDGRTDRQGRLWAGTMIEDLGKARIDGKINGGAMYSLDSQLQIRKHLSNLTITNSLCWSPDSSFLYHCDTPKQTIERYDFDPESGRLKQSSREQADSFIKTKEGCYPDGSTVDADGCIWNAQWGGSQVVRYKANGDENMVVSMPVSQPTCVAFGGENLDLMFVTTAYQDLSDEARALEPQAGDLFIYQTGFRGISESRFELASKWLTNFNN